VDPERQRAVPDGIVGEIWVTGASKALGYWNRPEESRATFEALLPGDRATYLRTGDLGFTQSGRLYVTGRMKELVIVRGRNYHPHEIEDAVRNAHPALSATAVAFSMTRDVDEALIVLCELRRTSRRSATADIPMAIQNELVRHLDLKADFIGLLKPGAVPRTTSGKIQRLKCKELYQSGLFDFVSVSPPLQAARSTVPAIAAPRPMRFVIEDWLVQWLSFRLKIPVEQIVRTQPLSAYGMDSLAAVQLSQSLEDWLDQPIPDTLAWSYPTIEQLSAQLEQIVHKPSQKNSNTAALDSSAAQSQVDLAVRSIERLSEGEVEQMFQRRLVKE
jgi:acyl carrier protein